MNSDNRSNTDQDRSWLDKIALLFSSEPRNRRDLRDVLRVAAENEVIDEDARDIMEGAMQVSDMQVRDIMVPRAQMTVIKAEAPLAMGTRLDCASVLKKAGVPRDELGKLIDGNHDQELLDRYWKLMDEAKS